MTSQALSLSIFKGLAPALGHMQNNEPRVLRGRNFRYRLSGPYSGWGNSVLCGLPSTLHPWVATFKIQDTIVYCIPEGIHAFNPKTRCWENVCPNDEVKIWEDCVDNDYPWTSAFVGDSWYFCHPTFGIARYSNDECKWEKMNYKCAVRPDWLYVDGSDGYEGAMIAAPYYGITQSNNRLILLAFDTVSWSEVDNGTKMSCDDNKGSGFQNLSVNRFGRPLGVYETPQGFNVYTTNGVTTFTEQHSGVGFRVDELSSNITPINPYVIISHDAKINMYLAKDGLYSTDGSYPKPWEPAVGKYLETLMDRTDILHNTAAIRIFYSPDTHEIFVSLTDPSLITCEKFIYNRSLVFHEHYEQWASFDQPHRYIGPSNAAKHRIATKTLGFISHDFHLLQFDENSCNALVCPPSLDSFIQIGVIALQDQQNINRITELQRLKIHCDIIPIGKSDADFYRDPLTSDNWEEQTSRTNTFNVLVAGTPDGYMVYDNTWSHAKSTGNDLYSKNYSCRSIGVGHIIQLSATLDGQFYSINRLDAQLIASTIA